MSLHAVVYVVYLMKHDKRHTTDRGAASTLAPSWGLARARGESLVGKQVQIRGLQWRPELNGCVGEVVTLHAESGRYVVQLPKHGQLALLPTTVQEVPTERRPLCTAICERAPCCGRGPPQWAAVSLSDASEELSGLKVGRIKRFVSTQRGAIAVAAGVVLVLSLTSLLVLHRGVFSDSGRSGSAPSSPSPPASPFPMTPEPPWAPPYLTRPQNPPPMPPPMQPHPSPPPRQRSHAVVDALNARWVHGRPSNNLSEAGVLIHLFDDYEDWSEKRPWRMCGSEEGCHLQKGKAKSGVARIDHLSCSVANAARPAVFPGLCRRCAHAVTCGYMLCVLLCI